MMREKTEYSDAVFWDNVIFRPNDMKLESVQLQRDQVSLLRQVAQGQREGVSLATRELAHSVGKLEQGLAGIGCELEAVNSVMEGLRIDVRQGFAGLGALIDWRMASVISLLEQSQTIYCEIREILKYPRKTEANEDKKDARKALRIALSAEGKKHKEWLTKALDYFDSAAKKNPFDYTAHLDLGTTWLNICRDARKSLSFFAQAALTSQDAGDAQYQSKAYFFAGRAHGVLGEYEEAYGATAEAVRLDPQSAPIAFECLRYAALTGRTESCDTLLEKLLRVGLMGGEVSSEESRAWWARLQQDEDFAALKPAMERVMDSLVAEARARAEREIGKAKDCSIELEQALQFASDISDVQVDEGEDARHGIRIIGELPKSLAILGYWDIVAATERALSAQEINERSRREVFPDALNKVKQEIQVTQESLDSERKSAAIEWNRSHRFQAFCCGTSSAFVYGIFDAHDRSIAWDVPLSTYAVISWGLAGLGLLGLLVSWMALDIKEKLWQLDLLRIVSLASVVQLCVFVGLAPLWKRRREEHVNCDVSATKRRIERLETVKHQLESKLARFNDAPVPSNQQGIRIVS